MSPHILWLKNRLEELKTRQPVMSSCIIATGRWQLEMCALNLAIAEAVLGGK